MAPEQDALHAAFKKYLARQTNVLCWDGSNFENDLFDAFEAGMMALAQAEMDIFMKAYRDGIRVCLENKVLKSPDGA